MRVLKILSRKTPVPAASLPLRFRISRHGTGENNVPDRNRTSVVLLHVHAKKPFPALRTAFSFRKKALLNPGQTPVFFPLRHAHPLNKKSPFKTGFVSRHARHTITERPGPRVFRRGGGSTMRGRRLRTCCFPARRPADSRSSGRGREPQEYPDG